MGVVRLMVLAVCEHVLVAREINLLENQCSCSVRQSSFTIDNECCTRTSLDLKPTVFMHTFFDVRISCQSVNFALPCEANGYIRISIVVLEVRAQLFGDGIFDQSDAGMEFRWYRIVEPACVRLDIDLLRLECNRESSR